MKNSKQTIINIAVSAMFAALIFLSTMFLKIPILTGYIHLGDSMIFIAASLLPPGYASFAAGFGASLADISGGFAGWAPWTFVIKALMAILISSKGKKILNLNNLLMVFVASVVNLIGYYIAEVAMTRNWIAAFGSLTWNLLQFAGGIIIYLIIASALDKTNVKISLNTFKERK